MGLLKFIRSLFGNSNASNEALEKNVHHLNHGFIQPTEEDTQAGFHEVFSQMLDQITGLKEIEKSEIQRLIERSEKDFQSPHLFQSEIWNRYFKGKDWIWTEYEEWNDIFNQLDRYPISFPDKVTLESIGIDEALSKFKVEDLKRLCVKYKVTFTSKSKKLDLITSLSSIQSIHNHEEVKLKSEEILNKFRLALYELFMRTARFRGMSLNELRRQKNLGIQRYKILHIHDSDKEFVDMALKRNPNALHPTFPSDASMKTPVFDFL